MKILIVTSKLDSGGTRIRYKRLVKIIKDFDFQLNIVEIKSVNSKLIKEHKIVILSKVYEVRSILIAKFCSDNNIDFGIDIFDNYFNIFEKRILNQNSYWINKILDLCSFAICSTEYTKNIIRHYNKNLKIHILEDSVESKKFDSPLKLSRIPSKRKSLKVLWFGIGDNPYFDVGLHDLIISSYNLIKLSSLNLEVELSILTNKRSLTIEKLIHIKNSFNFKYTIDEWSLLKEEEHLNKCDLVYLPVGFSTFSRAKTPNRVLTSLFSGTQVLNTGYELYSEFEKFIYKSPEEYLIDLKLNKFKLYNNSFNELCNSVERLIQKIFQKN